MHQEHGAQRLPLPRLSAAPLAGNKHARQGNFCAWPHIHNHPPRLIKSCAHKKVWAMLNGIYGQANAFYEKILEPRFGETCNKPPPPSSYCGARKKRCVLSRTAARVWGRLISGRERSSALLFMQDADCADFPGGLWPCSTGPQSGSGQSRSWRPCACRIERVVGAKAPAFVAGRCVRRLGIWGGEVWAVLNRMKKRMYWGAKVQKK